jgi:hypothetical protein
MRAVQLIAYGNPVEGLKYVDIPAPEAPGPDQVLIGVEFSPLNPSDLLLARGIYALRPALPTVIGNEGLEVFVTEIGARGPRLLWTAKLEITPEIFRDFKQPGHGLYFDWGPDAARYFAHVRPPPQTELPPFLREVFAAAEK